MRKWGILFLMSLVCGSACTPLPNLRREIPSPEDLLSQLQKHEQAIQGLKSLAQVKVSVQGKSFTTQDVLYVRRPSFLRIESLSPLGTPQFYMVTDGQELNLYYPGENKFYQGRVTNRLLSSALFITLEPEEVVAVLLGSLPWVHYESPSLQEDRREGLWLLDLFSTPGEEPQHLWVDPETRQITQAEFHSPKLSGRLNFSDFRSHKNLLFPMRIQLHLPESKTQFLVEYQDLEINPTWDVQDFQLSLPRGATLIPLE